MPTSKDQLEARDAGLRALLAAGTQDEWMPGIAGNDNLVAFGGDDIVGVANVGSERNLLLICAAVNALPALLDETERMRAGLQELMDWALNRAPGSTSSFSPLTAVAIATICENALRESHTTDSNKGA